MNSNIFLVVVHVVGFVVGPTTPADDQYSFTVATTRRRFVKAPMTAMTTKTTTTMTDECAF